MILFAIDVSCTTAASRLRVSDFMQTLLCIHTEVANVPVPTLGITCVYVNSGLTCRLEAGEYVRDAVNLRSIDTWLIPPQYSMYMY